MYPDDVHGRVYYIINRHRHVMRQRILYIGTAMWLIECFKWDYCANAKTRKIVFYIGFAVN